MARNGIFCEHQDFIEGHSKFYKKQNYNVLLPPWAKVNFIGKSQFYFDIKWHMWLIKLFVINIII